MSEQLPFNRPYTTGNELGYIEEAIANGHLSGNGPFARRCADWLRQRIGSAGVLLTHSCTGALEMAAMLTDLGAGDEVIMPSFTFVSTANAFALRGAVPVFVDIREDTLNLDERLVEEAVTSRTRAIVPVHYAGVGCDMDALARIAGRHGLTVIEDAAQGVMAARDGRPLGSSGALAALSFHETKNVLAGEGGALLVNDARLVERAEIIHEKGTDRSRFFRGQVDKYTWVSLGSSYVVSEINAAFLWAQLEQAEAITERRLALWERYHDAFEPLEEQGVLRRPVVPAGCLHNAHMYYLLLPDEPRRAAVIAGLAQRGVQAVFHYASLHESDGGRRHGRVAGALPVTERTSDTLVRMPLWIGMTDGDIARVAEGVSAALLRPARRLS